MIIKLNLREVESEQFVLDKKKKLQEQIASKETVGVLG